MNQRTDGEYYSDKGSHLVEVKSVQQVVEFTVFLGLFELKVILLETVEC